jgi:hypothetical protein
VDPVVLDGRGSEPVEHGQRGRVVRRDLRHDPLDSLRAVAEQVLEQGGGDAAALVLVRDRHRDVGRGGVVCVADHPGETGRLPDPLRVHDEQHARHMVHSVDLVDQVVEHPLGQVWHGCEEPVQLGLRREVLVGLTEPVPVGRQEPPDHGA